MSVFTSVPTTSLQEFTLSAEGARELRLSIPLGDLSIIGGGEEIRIRQEIEASADSKETEEHIVQRLELHSRLEDETWVVEPESLRGVGNEIRARKLDVRVTIHLPDALRLEARTGCGAIEAQQLGAARLHTGNGAITARDLAGEVELNSGHGAIEVERSAAPLSVKTGNGAITLGYCTGPVYAKSGFGPVSVEKMGAALLYTGNGAITVVDMEGPLVADTGLGRIEVGHLHDAELRTGNGEIEARNVQGSLTAKTGFGPIFVEECSGDVKAETGNGGIVLRQVAGSTRAKSGHGDVEAEVTTDGTTEGAPDAFSQELNSGKGDLTLRLPAGVSARLEAKTGYGRVEIDPQLACRILQAGKSRVEAVMGEGEGRIRLHTGFGRVRVEALAK